MQLFKPPSLVKHSKRELRDRLIGAAGNVTGVKMHPYAERAADLYETPPEAVHALLQVESFTSPIWECAAGRAHKPGTALSTLIKDSAILLSLALQHGADATTIRAALAPTGPIAAVLDYLGDDSS
jgi:hypothetical protein